MRLEGFEGIISALLTPDEQHLDKIPELIEFQLRHGIKGFFILGTFGEGPKLGPEARMRVAEKIVEAVGEKGIVIVHVGTPDLDTAKRLARHAGEIGAHAVSAVAPFYYRYDEESLKRFYEELAKSTSAPVMVYNNPGRQGYGIGFETIMRIMEEVPGVEGLKDTSGDVAQLHALATIPKERYFIAIGSDALIYMTFTLGLKAHVCGIASMWPELAVGIYRAVKEGRREEALELQLRMNRVRRILKSIGPDTASYKYALRMRGIDIGGPIPPTRGLTPEEERRLREEISQVIGT